MLRYAVSPSRSWQRMIGARASSFDSRHLSGARPNQALRNSWKLARRLALIPFVVVAPGPFDMVPRVATR
jgi:hypothetical protein